MSDAIDNLVQDINQNNTSVDEFPGYPGYQLGQEVPGMAGVRVGDLFYGLDPYGQEAPYNWRTGGFEFQAAPKDLSNPSTLSTGEGIDFNVRDQPPQRINIKSGDEQDTLIGGGVYTPQNQQQYITGQNVLVQPDKAGGNVGVDYLTPKEIADLTAGQTPSVPQGVVTPSKTVPISGKGLPDYIPIGQMENGDVLYADRNNLRDTIIRPSAYSISQEDLDKGIVPQKFNFGINTELAPSQKTPTSVGAVEPTTASEGGFDNTGGNVTVGTGVDDTIRFNPDYKEPEKGPGINPFIDSPWKVATGSGVNMDYIDPSTGKEFPADQDGNKWNFRTGEWDMAKPPGKDTGTTTTPPAGGGTGTGGTTTTPPGTGTGTTPTPGGGTTTTPPGGGTTTTPPGGGVRPGTGTGTGTYTGTPLPPREPVTPLVRRETVIPTKGTKEVPLPDRQADPFAKLYADLLANAQQQKDQYRYINYDPDQIMNAAMSGFRRRGAMRSLQGY